MLSDPKSSVGWNRLGGLRETRVVYLGIHRMWACTCFEDHQPWLHRRFVWSLWTGVVEVRVRFLLMVAVSVFEENSPQASSDHQFTSACRIFTCWCVKNVAIAWQLFSPPTRAAKYSGVDLFPGFLNKWMIRINKGGPISDCFILCFVFHLRVRQAFFFQFTPEERWHDCVWSKEKQITSCCSVTVGVKSSACEGQYFDRLPENGEKGCCPNTLSSSSDRAMREHCMLCTAAWYIHDNVIIFHFTVWQSISPLHSRRGNPRFRNPETESTGEGEPDQASIIAQTLFLTTGRDITVKQSSLCCKSHACSSHKVPIECWLCGRRTCWVLRTVLLAFSAAVAYSKY